MPSGRDGIFMPPVHNDIQKMAEGCRDTIHQLYKSELGKR